MNPLTHPLTHRWTFSLMLVLVLGPACAMLGAAAHAQSQSQSQSQAPGAGHNHAGHTGHAGHSGDVAASTQAAVPMTDAEVRRVDREAAKVTLRHGPIPNLDMPPMTMVFVAKDKALLEGLKAGDKVRFRAVEQQGTYIVTTIEPVR